MPGLMAFSQKLCNWYLHGFCSFRVYHLERGSNAPPCGVGAVRQKEDRTEESGEPQYRATSRGNTTDDPAFIHRKVFNEPHQ